MKVVAVVPARGGSKGIKNKNLYHVNGMPLIGYSLKTALACSDINSIFVSSDCDSILDYSKTFQGVSTLKRPSELATDDASSVDVLLHLLSEIKGEKFTHVLYLEPTSPFRSLSTINKSIEKLKYCKSTITVVESDGIYGHIEGELFKPFIADEARRRQDRRMKYKECSVVYGLDIENFEKTKMISDKYAYPIVIDELEALDINNYNDISYMEYILASGKVL